MSRLPVLMYHNVSLDEKQSKGLCISATRLEEQLKYLKEKKYKAYHLSELENLKVLNSKSVVITFDDVTVNQLDYAVPLLQKYAMKATFFIPFKYLGQEDLWNGGGEPIMTIEQLKSLPQNIELGFHSYEHRHFDRLTSLEVDQDFQKCFDLCKEHQLKISPSIAYPYGNYPKSEPRKQEFFDQLKKQGMRYGFRIGNKVNRFPFQDPFEVKRLDIKGQYSLFKFSMKLRFGKLL